MLGQWQNIDPEPSRFLGDTPVIQTLPEQGDDLDTRLPRNERQPPPEIHFG
jgi:hypothetical protein